MPGATRARGLEDASPGVVALHRSRFIEWQPAGVVALAASGDGSVLAAAREDGDIELYETATSYCFQVRLTSFGWSGQLETMMYQQQLPYMEVRAPQVPQSLLPDCPLLRCISLRCCGAAAHARAQGQLPDLRCASGRRG